MADESMPPVWSYDRWVRDGQYACTCPACYKFHVMDDRVLMNMVDGPNHVYEKFFKESKREWIRDCPVQAAKPKPKHHIGNGKPKGAFVGTLTMSPALAQEFGLNEAEMISAITKLFKQKTSPVKKSAWYLEYTQNGTPHIHFCYETASGGRILEKVFKRVWPIWDESVGCGAGHRGGYHTPMVDENGYLQYISKDKGLHAVNWS